MNCRYVQSRLSAYLDCELSGAEQQQIRSHLEVCIECSCEFESLRRTKQLLRQMPVVKPRSCPEQVLLRVRHSRLWRRVPFSAFAGMRRASGSMRAVSRWHRRSSFGGAPKIQKRRRSQPPVRFSPILPLPPLRSFPLLLPNSPLCTEPPPPTLFRRSPYPMYEHGLMPSVSYSVDPMLGYQPVSAWNAVPPQPKLIETQR
jgi:hypothetical protein